MKTLRLDSRTFFVLILILALFACKGSEQPAPENLNLSDGGSVEIGYQETKTITFEGKEYKLFFEDVADGRCSREVCYLCYGSFGTVKLVITSQSGDVERPALRVIGCGSNNLTLQNIEYTRELISLKNFRLGLSSLTPYPLKETDRIPKNAYKAKLIFSKL